MSKRKPIPSRFSPWPLCVFALLSSGISHHALSQCSYNRQEIVLPAGFQYLYPKAINNQGHVAGYMLAGDTDYAFFWTPEAGTLVLPRPAGVARMQAWGINDLDHVCGWMEWSSYVTAFLWTGEDYTLIYSPRGGRIEAYDVNNQDEVVGRILGGGISAFHWSNGTLIELDSRGATPQAAAWAINNEGVIVGDAGIGPSRHAYALDDEIRWLPEAGLASTRASVLSENGIFAGNGLTSLDQGDPNQRLVGVVWDGPATYSNDPPAGFRAAFFDGINSAGRAVGSYNSSTNFTRGFVWQSGVPHDLGSLAGGIYVSLVTSINGSGQITCHSSLGRLVLTPLWKTGDLTGDCAVSTEDLLIVLGQFGSEASSAPRGDVDFDGDVDIADLALLLSNWGI